jgi:hypothetical protein
MNTITTIFFHLSVSKEKNNPKESTCAEERRKFRSQVSDMFGLTFLASRQTGLNRFRDSSKEF